MLNYSILSMFYTKMNKSARTDYLAYCLQSRRVGYSNFETPYWKWYFKDPFNLSY